MSKEFFHIEAGSLLADAPHPQDLRDDTSATSPYFRLRDARSEARDEERRCDIGEGDASRARIHWRNVHDLAIEVLGQQTKDIEIAVWLTESMLRLNGVTGLADGFAILAGLVDRHWDDALYPALDREGAEARCAPIAGLNGFSADGTLMQPLRKITMYETADGQGVSLFNFQQADILETIGDSDRRQKRIDSGVRPLSVLEQEAASDSALRQLSNIRDGAVAALASWRALQNLLEEKAGDAAPSMERVTSLLNDITRIAQRYAPAPTENPAIQTKEINIAVDQEETIEPVREERHPLPAPTMHDLNSTKDRAAQLAHLREIADFFRRTEPSSPLAYTLDEAIRRAEMRWPDLLTELVPDKNARNAILATLGIRPTQSAG